MSFKKLRVKSTSPDAVVFRDRNGNIILQVDTDTGTVTIGGNIVIAENATVTGNLSAGGTIGATGAITSEADITAEGDIETTKTAGKVITDAAEVGGAAGFKVGDITGTTSNVAVLWGFDDENNTTKKSITFKVTNGLLTQFTEYVDT